MLLTDLPVTDSLEPETSLAGASMSAVVLENRRGLTRKLSDFGQVSLSRAGSGMLVFPTSISSPRCPFPFEDDEIVQEVIR